MADSASVVAFQDAAADVLAVLLVLPSSSPVIVSGATLSTSIEAAEHAVVLLLVAVSIVVNVK